VQRVVFVVGKRGDVQASVLTDVQGNTNRLVFSNTKIDQKLDAARFTFTPPAGATVQELP
jgi:outer membrane lipoprotein-sorting protein